jgi:uncharacterized protein YbjT (DUF2867 family)
MKLTVIGSTGRTGRLVVAEAARRGHRITAFTRRPQVLPEQPGVIKVVHGDGRDAQDLRDAVTGADAVIAIVAAATRKGPHQTAEVAGVLTDQMAALDVPRLIITSAYPIVATAPRLPIALLNWVLADAYADVRAMEGIVTSSDLDWRIARLNRLTDAPARGGTRISRDVFARPAGITRADAATALIDIAGDDSLSQTAVNIAGPAPR